MLWLLFLDAYADTATTAGNHCGALGPSAPGKKNASFWGAIWYHAFAEKSHLLKPDV